MRYILYDVLSDYSLSKVEGKSDFSVDLPRAPFVYNGLVNIVVGETLLVQVEETGGILKDLRYVDEMKHPEKTLAFKFEIIRGLMMLNVTNPSPRTIRFRAAMQPAADTLFYDTSTCPVMAGGGSYESWSQPLVQLILYEFRFIDNSDGFACE